ncbi:hypothetical protein H6P81_020481 [Aristolochia fimbriata]|uniref:Uncharacterized protein n=1 Tax=Aristolochia fimbriata TaxID=158543 RepID=A0AAV7DVQ3_ARIFI|nr:hypothetical protein H6P81_020481 [Aristolochia fimbriata]
MGNRKYFSTALRFTLLSVLVLLYLGAILECKTAKATGLLKADKKPKPEICKCAKVTPRLWKCNCTDMNFFSEKQCLNSCHINATTTKPKPDESCKCVKVTPSVWKCNCTDVNFFSEKQCLNSCHNSPPTMKPETYQSCKFANVTDPLLRKRDCTDMNFTNEQECLHSCHNAATIIG